METNSTCKSSKMNNERNNDDDDNKDDNISNSINIDSNDFKWEDGFSLKVLMKQIMVIMLEAVAIHNFHEQALKAIAARMAVVVVMEAAEAVKMMMKVNIP